MLAQCHRTEHGPLGESEQCSGGKTALGLSCTDHCCAIPLRAPCCLLQVFQMGPSGLPLLPAAAQGLFSSWVAATLQASGLLMMQPGNSSSAGVGGALARFLSAVGVMAGNSSSQVRQQPQGLGPGGCVCRPEMHK